MQSCGTVPLISPWLYRQYVRRIVKRVSQGEIPAVQELADVFCTSIDQGARDIAGQGLMHLKISGQTDLLLQECILRDNSNLTAIATGCGYLPAAPAGRALWFFCTARTDELRLLDPEEHFPLLAKGYAAAGKALRAQARDAARRDSTCSILAAALTGDRVTRNAARWSYGEWEIVITGIIGAGRWDDLWLLASLAPVPLAVAALRSLKTAGWSPGGDDRIIWDELTRDLPEQWVNPVLKEKARDPVGRAAAQVSRLCFSADGSLLATGCCDGMITVWRTGSAGLVAELRPGPDAVRFLGIPAGNSCLVNAGDDGKVRCHNLEDHALLWSWENKGGCTAITLSPEGHTVIIGDSSGVLHVIDSRDGRARYTMQLHSSPITCLAPVPADSSIVCGHADGTVSVARPGDGAIPLVLPGNGSAAHSLSPGPSGTECLAIYEAGLPTLWDTESGSKIRTFTGFGGRVLSSAIPDGSTWFATGCEDHMIRCWNRNTPSPVSIIPLYHRYITSLSAAPDGSHLAAGCHDGSVRIYHMPDGKLVQEYKGHKKTITSCTIDPVGNRLATVSWDGTTKLWRIPGGEIVRTLDAHAGGIAALAGPAGSLIITVTDDGITRLIDGSDGSLLRTIDLYTPSVRSASMSSDGTYLACTGADSSIRIWNLHDGSLAAAGDRLKTSRRCCTFLPDGSTLVTGGWDGSLRFQKIPDLTLLRTLAGHTSIVTCCTVSREGDLLVSGSNDTTVRLWRMDEDEAYAVLRESRSEVRAVALSMDGTLLAAGNAEGNIRLYRLPYGIPETELPDIPGKVNALVFTPDNCTLAAGYDTGTCALFSLPDRSLIQTIPAHSGAVTGLAILPDGRTLVSSGGDGICCFHTIPVKPFLVHASLTDIDTAASDKEPRGQRTGPDPAAFHRTLLAIRFRSEIEICPPVDVAGCYDIQIVG